MTPVRIATRASDLALAQARLVAGRIEAELGVASEICPMKTRGDRLAGSLAKLGGKGLFVKELEEALLEGRADVAVHSAKDLPAELPPGLEIAAVPEREDPRDALVAKAAGATLAGLPAGARVGTGSLRRAAQLRRAHPRLEVAPLRGNVPTRLRKLEQEAGLDAVILACAGLARLGLAGRIAERIAAEAMLPAVGQGALALETRRGDPLARALRALDDEASARALAAERAFLAGLGGDCSTPLAGFAELESGPDESGSGPDGAAPAALRLRGLLVSSDGARLARAELREQRDPAAAGARLAREVLAAGGAEILAELRAGEGAG